MFSTKQITETITEGNSLKFLAESYTEIASARLRKIRAGIERNRMFLHELATMYATIKLVAAQRNIQTQAPRITLQEKASRLFRKESAPQTTGQNPKKATINVLLTSNDRFYGSLEHMLIRFFLKNNQYSKARLPDGQAKTIVVGKTGVDFFKFFKLIPAVPVIFKKDFPSSSELRVLISHIASYERVLVYHAKFQTVLSQTPSITDIKEAQFEVSIPKRRFDYIFEPEIDKMLLFFDTQISSILLTQTFLESELAHTAARLIAMDNAQENAKRFTAEQERLLAQTRRHEYNARLLATIASMFVQRRNTHG